MDDKTAELVSKRRMIMRAALELPKDDDKRLQLEQEAEALLSEINKEKDNQDPVTYIVGIVGL